MHLKGRLHLQNSPSLAKCQMGEKEISPHHWHGEVKAASAASRLNHYMPRTLLSCKNASERFSERRWNVFKRESVTSAQETLVLPPETARERRWNTSTLLQLSVLDQTPSQVPVGLGLPPAQAPGVNLGPPSRGFPRPRRRPLHHSAQRFSKKLRPQ